MQGSSGAIASLLCTFRKRRRIDEEKLSTAYNYYKFDPERQRCEKMWKLLRRQFSLDKTEEHMNEGLKNSRVKLCK